MHDYNTKTSVEEFLPSGEFRYCPNSSFPQESLSLPLSYLTRRAEHQLVYGQLRAAASRIAHD